MHHLTLQGSATVGCWSSSTTVWPTLLSWPGLCSTWSSPSAPSSPGPPATTTGIQVRQTLQQYSWLLHQLTLWWLRKKFCFRVLFFKTKWHKRLEQQDQHNFCCHWILGVCWWANLASFQAIPRFRLVVILFFLPDNECWLSQEALRRSGVCDGKFFCV